MLFRIYSLIFFIASAAGAQTLQLFEETESTDTSVSRSSPSNNRRDSDGNLISGPEFTLVGTTRIGSNYLVVVEDRSGEIISVSLSDGSSSTIPGHNRFTVLRGEAGETSVQFPEGISCVPFPERGVTCESVSLARLGLTNAEPLAISEVLDGSSDLDSNTAENEESPTNPFEALLERAASTDQDADTTAFQPRRIDPQDVPPGMRVVSTPFGDRLVEDE